jgi:hypothetical protein
MELGLKGKKALVEGASTGLGLAVAQALCAEGVRVAIASSNLGRIEKAGSEIGAFERPEIRPPWAHEIDQQRSGLRKHHSEFGPSGFCQDGAPFALESGLCFLQFLYTYLGESSQNLVWAAAWLKNISSP